MLSTLKLNCLEQRYKDKLNCFVILLVGLVPTFFFKLYRLKYKDLIK